MKDFHVAYDTIRKFLDFDPNIKFETIAKFCYVIGHYLHVEHEAVDNYKSKSISRIETKDLHALSNCKDNMKKSMDLEPKR